MRSYLADTSALARRSKVAVRQVLDPLVRRRDVAICAPVRHELVRGVPAWSARELAWALLGWPTVRVTDATFERAGEIQLELADRSQHAGISIVDLLVAAAAEAHGLAVLHYDHDFELIASVTGQAHRWVVPAGSAD